MTSQITEDRLIAAAPDLYEALRSLVALYEAEDRPSHEVNWPPAIKKAKAALLMADKGKPKGRKG